MIWSASLPQLLPSPSRRTLPPICSPPASMDPFNRYSKPSIHPSPRFTNPTPTPMPLHATPPTSLSHDRHRTAWKQPSYSHMADMSVPPGQVSIPHLRDAIHNLDSTMASLLNQRKELQSHLEQAVRSQSPVLRLPGELLSSIFVIGVQAAEEEDQLMVSCLMLVCRYWAEVVVNTPMLWSKVTVSKHDSLNKACRRLARSKSVPVDLTINFDPRLGHSGSVMESVVRAMDLFRPALWRARSFCLTVPSRVHAHAALLRCQEDAPLLEVLTVRVSNSIEDDNHTRPPLPLFNGRTPRLRSCSFTSLNFSWDVRTVRRLRVLKLNGYFLHLAPSIETLLAILYECPELEELVLRDMSEMADTDPFECLPGDENYRPSARKVITLRHLKKISIRCVGITRTRAILAHLSFPSLHDLDLGYLTDIRPIIHQLETQSLISLPLQRLHIESCVFNELKFGQLLRRLPSLTTLELIDSEDVSSCLLKSLSKPPSGHPWICPRLEILSLEGCTSLQSDSLQLLIESRLPAQSYAYPLNKQPGAATPFYQGSTSASGYARSQAINASPSGSMAYGLPRRLRSMDVTRCHQISKEMVQWMKMYVADVKYEQAWGDHAMRD